MGSMVILMLVGFVLENVRRVEERNLEEWRLRSQEVNEGEEEEESPSLSAEKIADILRLCEGRAACIEADAEGVIIRLERSDLSEVEDLRKSLEKKNYRCYLKEGQGQMTWEKLSLIIKN